MDERRGDQPAAGTGRARIAASGPTATQKARAAYVTHATECPRCSDIDRERCGKGGELWHAWNEACDDAYRRLAKEWP